MFHFITPKTKELPLVPDKKIIVIAGDASASLQLAQRVIKTVIDMETTVLLVSRMHVPYDHINYTQSYGYDDFGADADYLIYVVGEPTSLFFSLLDKQVYELNALEADCYVANNTMDSYGLECYQHCFLHEASGITPSLYHLYATDGLMLREFERRWIDNDSILSAERNMLRQLIDRELKQEGGVDESCSSEQ
ncbi:hypothetical protein ACS5HP_002934 [Vibrio alginolyticus]